MCTRSISRRVYIKGEKKRETERVIKRSSLEIGGTRVFIFIPLTGYVVTYYIIIVNTVRRNGCRAAASNVGWQSKKREWDRPRGCVYTLYAAKCVSEVVGVYSAKNPLGAVCCTIYYYYHHHHNVRLYTNDGVGAGRTDATTTTMTTV